VAKHGVQLELGTDVDTVVDELISEKNDRSEDADGGRALHAAKQFRHAERLPWCLARTRAIPRRQRGET
jgi:hypothetical protein